MHEESDNAILVYLQYLDAKMDRMAHDMSEMRQRLAGLELQFGAFVGAEQSHYAVAMQRLDSIDQRLNRMERRQDLAGGPNVSGSAI